MALVDLNDFRAVNELHGYEIGDQVLRACAAHLIKVLSPWRVFRFGGDEFAIEIPGHVGREEAQQTLLDAVIWELDDGLPAVDSTIGICVVAVSGDPMDAAIVADDARYRARLAGHPVHAAKGISQPADD